MPETSSNTLPNGTELGNFRIIEKISEGGMGTVYRARQISLGRMVALKILSPHLTSDPSYVDGFRKESLAAAAFHHPNLISVFDSGEVNGTRYYAMEFVEGETLHRWLSHAGRLPESTSLEIVLCACNALKYGWDKARLIHRDVKPDNIMIDTDGNVKVCDLGLAKIFDEDALLNTDGPSLGTPHYVSPEQARGITNLDQRSDIYSLGMTLYHMLTGKTPFPDGTPASILSKQLTEQLPDPREFNPKISCNICRVLEKMLGKDLSDRYQSWEEVKTDLNRVSVGQTPLCQPLPAGKSTLHRNPQFDVLRAATQHTRSHSVTTITKKPKSLKRSETVVWIFVLVIFGIFLILAILSRQQTSIAQLWNDFITWLHDG